MNGTHAMWHFPWLLITLVVYTTIAIVLVDYVWRLVQIRIAVLVALTSIIWLAGAVLLVWCF